MSVQALALSALTLIPATIAADKGTIKDFQPVDAISAAKMDATLTDSLLNIEKLVQNGDRNSILDAIAELQKRLAAAPTNEELRLRVAAVLQDLIDRAQSAYIEALDLAMARRQMVDARLDRAFVVLRERAIAGGWTPEQVRSVAMQWLERADVFVDAPDPAEYRARIMAAMEMILLTTAGVAESIGEMRLELLRLQLQAAISRLEQGKADGTITERDYERLLEIFIARARVIAQSLI